MHQMENTISIPFVTLTLILFSLTSFALENSASSVDLLDNSVFDFEKPRDSILDKRVYDYLSEYKRYPLYNFGLGKRSSHLYNFGLGKRLDEGGDNLEEYDEYSYNEDNEHIPELELYPDDAMQRADKRQKMYSFGLGKRLYRYDFGLGKRSQPVVNRDKLYNFGLGKRNRLYSFGLGKRPYNQGPIPGRFNFGLGKRSENIDLSENQIAKREIHEEKPPQTTSERNLEAATDSSQNSGSNLEKVNSTGDELESHEIMAHFDKSHLAKRSTHKFAFERGKPVFRPNAGFSRQFRRPLYNFGLGKRMPSSSNIITKNTIPGK